jgi:cytochrome c-type biogenesis protein CcmF
MMIAELGLYSLILALMVALMLALTPLFSLKKPAGHHVVTQYAVLQFILIALSYLCLTICFLRDDFSLIYVLNNSSRALPWFYKLCAVWGGHEGSMLLWVLILSFWTSLFALCSGSLEQPFRVKVLSILACLSIGFLLFILATSNPFLRQFQDLHGLGRDLNPLLQDPGFLLHPPMLYLGYVGFALPFAIACCALWEGRLEASWCQAARFSALLAWSFLTLGITLGSWWAYRELGWGGFWFWDPVENASFMPWLMGTALIHSLLVTAKKGQFAAWTLLFAVMAFSLSLIGTFLVRSGVLTSVHAFAVDPARGLYILGFLVLVIGGSLGLFLFRAQTLDRNIVLNLISRETALLLNTILLLVMTLTILMGTLYPLIIDGLGLGKLSVGAPYFNRVFGLLMIPFLILMGLGIQIKWGRDELKSLMNKLGLIAVPSILLPLLLMLLCRAPFYWSAFLAASLASFIVLTTLQRIYSKALDKGLLAISRSYWGMSLAHCGIAAIVLGVCLSTTLGEQDDLMMKPGQTTQFHGYSLQFIDESTLQGPNYRGTKAQFIINHHIKLYPEKRFYPLSQMPMTIAAIDATPFRDLYLALGEPQNDNAWSLRIYYKPFVRFIWIGGLMILAGGLCAASRTLTRMSKKQ